MSTKAPSVGIIGAGLAGSEAALVLARLGVQVELFEMRPQTTTPAHKTGLPAELVCSNSLKSNDLPSAQALLKKELLLCNSPLLKCALESSVPAGSALAVDRIRFSTNVLQAFHDNPAITLRMEEMSKPREGHAYNIISAGPLASGPLVRWLIEMFSEDSLQFYDAIAPIIALDSIDTKTAFYSSRWKPQEPDYLNCPFTEEEYNRFYAELIAADTAIARDFEDERFFEACLPLEIIAQRGRRSMAFGPLKPIGFTDPRTGKRPYALCQLRRETRDGDSFSMVGFQTRLTIPFQQKVFRLIPGLEHARFLRFGSCHRNTYLNSPKLLSYDLSFKKRETFFLAGQLCGNEGYTESIATGHLAALFICARLHGRSLEPPPATTACGALLRHVTASEVRPFSPSSFHFGLLPSSPETVQKKIGKREKHEMLCNRALQDFTQWRKTSIEVIDLTDFGKVI
jgi:methylenetetrahydrofolate--tRNA-(uracil-5-)-methyltransferase